MDENCRCCNCRFYDDMDSSCHAHPPVYSGDREDGHGGIVASFRQPDVDCSWVEWCGEWKASDESQTKEQRWQQIKKLRRQWAEAHDPELLKMLNELSGK